jgi:signal transduction histidine kinase
MTHSRECAHEQLSRVLKLQLRTTELESSLQSAQQQAESRARFLANVSHEIRTPLHSVVGFSELSEFSALAPATSTRRSLTMTCV